MMAPDTFAAVDLGSNSFHLVVARVVEGEVRIVDRMRDPVRLGAGLDSDLRLTPAAEARALKCLELFGQRLRGLPAVSVRAVGTSTLRRARNSSDFVFRAASVLGHPIEIISGREEARLVYLGVAHSLEDDGARRLVIDIGGGSTECVLGEHFEPLAIDSLNVGCVTLTSKYFADGEISAAAMHAAEMETRLELAPTEMRFRAPAFDTCMGASGTIATIEQVLRQSGWSKSGITAAGLARLGQELVAAGRVSKLSLPGLKGDRVPVFPAGVAILTGLFDALGIRRMAAASGALREGVLFDLLGRMRHEDVRDQSIKRLGERHRTDVEQAARVERTAVALLRQIAESWDLPEETWRPWLSWAAQVHEVGLAVSHSGHHKHGAYLVANSDLPGFSRDDQALLAGLIRVHRRKFAPVIRDTPALGTPQAVRLAILLRLSALLNRSRSQQPLPPFVLAAERNTLTLTLPPRWLDDQPLTRADLESEVAALADGGFALVLKTGAAKKAKR